MSITGHEVERGTGLRKQGGADARARRKAQDTLYLAVSLGMLILLITVMALVAVRAPDSPSTPDTINPWLKMHYSLYYFIEAESLVKPLIQAPVEKWSRQFYDANTGCIEIGNGVWYACGMVDTTPSRGLTVHQPWVIYFVAETATPLFSKVGDMESGDLTQAQQLAQSKPSIDGTGP